MTQDYYVMMYRNTLSQKMLVNLFLLHWILKHRFLIVQPNSLLCRIVYLLVGLFKLILTLLLQYDSLERFTATEKA